MIIDPKAVPAVASYRILVSAVVPRPIAFVSTVSPAGVYNLAPFSFFNVVSAEPPIVCFSPMFREPRKDTLANIQATGEFVVNIVSEEFAEQMNLCAGEYPADVDEFKVSGLTPTASDVVRAPRVRESHVNMECRLREILEVSTRPLGGSLVLGEVVLFHIDDAMIDNYRLNADKLRAVGRMSGSEYSRTRDRFALVRP
jgi:flavin reductase (DIM6/NTAB) family NADH-FMN oxidoreductase RutF